MTASYRQAVTHADEPSHIVQPDCSTTVEDSTFLFSFQISELQVCSTLVQNMSTGSLVLLAFRTQLTVAESLFSSQIRVNYVTKATRESVQSICKQWLP
jgi:hypothetical protein